MPGSDSAGVHKPGTDGTDWSAEVRRADAGGVAAEPAYGILESGG